MTEVMLVAELAGTRIALPAASIRSVIEVESLASVPHAPPHIAGVTAVRSQALTVIDPRASLGLPLRMREPGECAAIVPHDGHLYALMLDRIDDVHEAQSAPQPVSGGYGAGWERVALGMVELPNGPALLVDIGAIIAGHPHALT